MLWIGFVHTLCKTVLQNDAPHEVRSRLTPAYERLLMALGVPTHDHLAARQEQISQILPDLWHVAEEIIQTNPAIRE